MKCVAATIGVVMVGMFGVLNAQADFVPQNAFTQDANTVMLSHFDGSLKEEVTGLNWDFGSFNGTNKDLSGSYVNTPTYSNGYGKAAGQGIISAGTGSGGLRFSFTPFLSTPKWSQGTIEWWEVYQVQLPYTQNNVPDFSMLNEGTSYHKYSQVVIGQERYNDTAYLCSYITPSGDVPSDLLLKNNGYEWTGSYSSMLTTATGKNYIAGQERHHTAITWGPNGVAWWIDGKKAWSNPNDTGAVYNPYWSGMHYYNQSPYAGFQNGAIYLGCGYDGQMSNQVFDEFRFSSVDRYSVPEPSVMVLLAMGALGLIRRK